MDELRKISVKTKPNGYALDIEGTPEGFFYFDEHALLEGFMFHVGLKEDSSARKEYIKRLVQAAGNWPDNEALVKKLDEVEQRVKYLEDKNESLKRAAKRMGNRAERYKAILEKYDKKAAEECIEDEDNEKANCAYLRTDDGCKWCELGIISCDECTAEMIRSLSKKE